MEFARDAKGQLVPAARADRYKTYHCPVCKAPVTLRLGDLRIAHFAHWPGYGTAACELFCPADNVHGPLPPILPSNPHVPNQTRRFDPVNLSIEVERSLPASRITPRAWRLRITLPRADRNKGQISFDLGDPGPRRIPASKLYLNTQTYAANPDARHFRAVWFSPEISSEYKAVLSTGALGLGTSHATAFVGSADRLKRRADHLFWGRDYYLVWRRDLKIEIPPAILLKPLAQQHEWCATFISLPDEPNSVLQQWIDKVIGIPITAQKRRWSLIYPVGYDTDADGRINVPITSQILVGLHNEGPLSTQEDEFSAHDADGSASVKLPSGKQHLAKVDFTPSHLQRLSLSWGDRNLGELIGRTIPSDDHFPSVAIGTKDIVSGEETWSPLHSRAIEDRLAHVRRGKLDIIQIRFSNALSGKLRWRKHGTATWALQILNKGFGSNRAGFSSITLGDDDLSTLVSIVRNNALDCVIDWGSFGRALLVGSAISSESVGLSEKLRTKLRWYCRLGGMPAAHDGALIDAFKRIPPTPFLIPHKRMLERELNAVLLQRKDR